MKKIIKQSAFLLLFSGCLGLFQTRQLSQNLGERTVITKASILADTRTRQDRLNISKQLPVLGFNSIRADIIFLSFLQYFGDDDMRKQSDYSLSPSFFEAIVSTNPYNRDFYVFLTNSVSLSAGQPEKSVKLMEKGLVSLSPQKPRDSFYIWRYKGVDELLFLGNSQASQRSFRNAADWAQKSNLPESDLIASVSQQTADFLGQNPNSKAAQISAWGSILTTAPDDVTRERAVQSIQALGGEITVDDSGDVEIK